MRSFAAGAMALGAASALPQSAGEALRGGLESGAAGTLGANAAFLAAAGGWLAWEVRTRGRETATLAKELQLGAMALRGTTRLGADVLTSVRGLRGARRCCVLYGTREELQEQLLAASVYRRRLGTSKVTVVPVCCGGPEEASALERWAASELSRSERWRWLAFPAEGAARWAGWFERVLLGGSGGRCAYVTVGSNGRVRGSAVGRARFDALLSTFPANLPEDRSGAPPEGEAAPEGREAEAEAQLLAAHGEFYAALLAGDEGAMESLWLGGEDGTVGRYVRKGARRDGWETVLREDRRPVGLEVTDADVTVRGERAWVTCVERVPGGSTLLATQTFRRRATGGGRWALVGHRTVPYGVDIVAKVVLRCDAAGCVAVPAKTQSSYAGEDEEGLYAGERQLAAAEA